jgi:hypothetical protein
VRGREKRETAFSFFFMYKLNHSCEFRYWCWPIATATRDGRAFIILTLSTAYVPTSLIEQAIERQNDIDFWSGGWHRRIKVGRSHIW